MKIYYYLLLLFKMDANLISSNRFLNPKIHIRIPLSSSNPTRQLLYFCRFCFLSLSVSHNSFNGSFSLGFEKYGAKRYHLAIWAIKKYKKVIYSQWRLFLESIYFLHNHGKMMLFIDLIGQQAKGEKGLIE